MATFKCSDCMCVMVPGSHMPHHLDDCLIAQDERLVGWPQTFSAALWRLEPGSGRPAYQLMPLIQELDLGPRRTYAQELEDANAYRPRPIAEPWEYLGLFGWECLACNMGPAERTASHAQVGAVQHNRARHPRRARRWHPGMRSSDGE